MISKQLIVECFFENHYMKATGTDETEFTVITIKGIDTLPMTRQTAKSPFQDGSTVVNSTANNRQIDMRILTLESNRELIMNLFNVKKSGLMRVTRNGITRQINYLVEGTPSPDEHIHPYIFFDIRLLCPDPWFRDVNSFGKNLAQVQKLHGFPLLWLVGKGYGVEKKTTSTKTGLVNAGHDATPFTCRIKARNTVINPSISTTHADGTVLTIKVKVTLGRNEYIDIISHDYPPETINVPLLDHNQTAVTVILNGTKNILDRTDIRNTTFFLLERGVNPFEYTADEGISHMDVYPEFRGRFVGV